MFFLFAFAGCVTPAGQGEVRAGEIERDCVIPIPAGIRTLGAPVSIEYPDGSLWIWESLDLDDGSAIANPSARMLRVNDACSRPPAIALDDGDRPRSLLALTPEEVDANFTRTDGRHLALAPTGGFSHDGIGYLYYDHVLRGPGPFDAEVLGGGLCMIEPKSTTCDRVRSADSTLLWHPDERVMNRGGFVVGNRAILAGCRQVGPLREKCTVSTVHLANVRDPWAYNVYSATDGWVDELVDATAISDTNGALTLAPFDDGYIAVELDIFANEVGVRLSDRAETGYRARQRAFDVLAPTEWFVSGGREHSSLRTDPRSIAVSYATDHRDAPGLHLVDLRVFDRSE